MERIQNEDKMSKKPVVPFLRSTYNYDMNEAGDESGLKCEDPSLTQQHQAEETDINYIVNRYLRTGELQQRSLPPMQGDFTEAPDMQTAMNLVVEARNAFMEQPADVRARFGNDPVEFVNFCSNEKNRDELRKMGLWSPEAVAAWDRQEKLRAEYENAGKEALNKPKASKETPQKGVT